MCNRKEKYVGPITSITGTSENIFLYFSAQEALMDQYDLFLWLWILCTKLHRSQCYSLRVSCKSNLESASDIQSFHFFDFVCVRYQWMSAQLLSWQRNLPKHNRCVILCMQGWFPRKRKKLQRYVLTWLIVQQNSLIGLASDVTNIAIAMHGNGKMGSKQR